MLHQSPTKKILVVDDHPDLATSMARLLEALGYEALPLDDPRKAVPVAKQFKPEIALFDLAMPHVDGITLAKIFRSDEDLRSVCLVAVTAYADALYRAMTQEAGFTAHVAKPVDERTLQTVIAECEQA